MPFKPEHHLLCRCEMTFCTWTMKEIFSERFREHENDLQENTDLVKFRLENQTRL